MDARPTLQDIADLIGVGKATVSLALRNHPKISAATRARVQAAAEKLGYRPDPALSRIAAHRWRSREHPADFVVAYLTMRHPQTKTAPLENVRQAATQHGSRLGYVVEQFWVDDYATAGQLARVLVSRGIRAVLLGQLFNQKFIDEFPWASFCTIACHVGYVTPPVNLVLPDFNHAVVQIWKDVVARGYRRIGVVLLREMEAVDLFDKVSAVLYCQSRLTPHLPVLPVRHFGVSDKPAVAAWVREEKPEVVLGFNDTVYWWIRDAPAAIPHEVAFVSLDTMVDRPPHEPSIAGMDPDYAQIGRTAMEQLDLVLRTNQQGIPARRLCVHVPYIWREGASLPAAKASPPTATAAAG